MIMRVNFIHIICLLIVACPVLLLPQDLPADDIWSSIRLPVPKRDTDRNYLGLSKGDTFTIDQIQARIIVVQVYSMYCPICQREAEGVNTLFQLISGAEKISGQTKLLAIGAGNSEFEVDFYRKTYDVKFPLFSDGDFKLHKRLGEVGTPYFYIFERDKKGGLRLVYDKAGAFTSPDHFLGLIRERLK